MHNITALKEMLAKECPQLELREQEALSRHTSFRIGGPVSLMALPKTKHEAQVAIRAAAELAIAPFFLGKGSNLLVADEGINCFAIKYVSGQGSLARNGELEIRAGAGLSLAQIAVFAMEEGLSGMEFAHGIPGSLGGAVVMNAGAYEGEMSQIVREVVCLSKTGEEEILSVQELDFRYRHSVFSDETRLIVEVCLRLVPGKREEIWARMQDLMERRRSKQPLEFPSAGSTFKRPPGHFAGALIEAAGLKGAAIGGAQVSEKHAGFVVNAGGATCEDVLRLMRAVRQIVQVDTGIVLEPEIRLLGCSL